MNKFDNLEKAMAEALGNLSERVSALEAQAAAPAPSARFYAVGKSDDDHHPTDLAYHLPL
ncbi:MAG TPA: hypothetical protein VHT03_06370 [Rhizomicrobium sp.]|jgi:hypothetical protein|nr:hypothetical protein [Rhizomicrobium sp.]